MELIDTHVHLNFEGFQHDLDSLQSRWREAGVVHLVHSCVHPNEFESIRHLADRFSPTLSFAVGLHPLDVDKWTDSTRDLIITLAKKDPRVVAIGEMGLDFYKADNRLLQREVLLAQLEIARLLDKPVIIHCRSAAALMREVLTEFCSSGAVRGVMHCWGGTPEETKWFLALGFYISFSGLVTFKNAKNLQASAKMVPSDRLLIETDCPFLAPVPKRGFRNEPAYVLHVAQHLSRLRSVPLTTLAAQTTANARSLFQLNFSYCGNN
ncbi:MAG: TatD family hydrolase [Prochloron sp. SP5CPC1]|nr:TatD family hydrolase [Candidatus Paraprochloron terpiosi SP5CPC1]